MASRRLGLTSTLSSSTISSHPPAYHPPPSSSPLLSPTSPFSSSVFPSIQTQRRKQNRKLLAEKQELERIMDPTYLGSSSSSSSSFSKSVNSRWNTCQHADPEGYWHDIDYKPFPKIKPSENEIKRSFTSSSFSSRSESCHDHWTTIHPLPRRISTNAKRSKSQEPLAYWETFTVLPSTPITPFHLSNDNKEKEDEEEEEEEEVKSEYEYYSTLKNRPFPRSPSPSSSSSEMSYSYIVDDARRGVLKKKKKKTNSQKGDDDTVDNLCSNEEDIITRREEEEEEEREKIKLTIHQSTLKNSKTKTLHEAWVIMSFIARLKVIRAQRWLRKRVLSCP